MQDAVNAMCAELNDGSVTNKAAVRRINSMIDVRMCVDMYNVYVRMYVCVYVFMCFHTSTPSVPATLIFDPALSSTLLFAL